MIPTDKESTFKRAIEENKDKIYRLCRSYVQKADEHHDVYQEVLIHIWQSLDTFEAKSQISTWIYRVTVNTCLGYLRTEKRRRILFDDSNRLEALDAPDPGEGDPSTDRDIERLYVCIGQLPPLERALISLFLEDVSTKEMADIFEMSEVNVRVKLHRIRTRVKALWEGTEHGIR